MTSVRLSTLLLPLVMAGCALFTPPPLAVGQTEAEVLAVMGRAPNGRHALADGVTRLEFATGPMGRTTWMVDLAADGRTRAFRQVLTTENLADFQVRAPGMTVPQLLAELGRPGEKMGVRAGEVWSWRYPTYDCLLWQVTVGRDGKVIDAGYGIDWMCDHNDKVSMHGGHGRR
ncbi:MAG: hypothetical protein U1F56_05040 [Rubrivivax sp.]